MRDPQRRPRRIAVAIALALTAALVSGCTAIKPLEAGMAQVGVERTGTVAAFLPAAGRDGHPPLHEGLAAAFAQQKITVETATAPDAAVQVEQLTKARTGRQRTVLVQSIDQDRTAQAQRALVEAGITVMCLGERPRHRGTCSVLVGWSPYGTGAVQARMLEQRLGPRPEDRRWNMEMLALAPGDKSGQAQFTGTILTALPFRAGSPFQTKTGQNSYSQVAVPGARPELVQRQLTTTLVATFSAQPLDALVLPSDDLITPVRESLSRATLVKQPVLISAGATPAGITALAAGQIAATTYFDPATLNRAAAQTLAALRAGRAVETEPRIDKANFIGDLPAVWVNPYPVTRANAAQVLKDAPELLAALG